VPGVFDQGVAAGLGGDGVLLYDTTSTHLTQGITPAHSGLLTYVELNCKGDDTSVVTLKVGSSTAQNVCPSDGYYQRFVFSAPATVTSGTPFTLGIDTGGASVYLAYATSPYAGGTAADSGNPIVIESDPPVTLATFSFMTYVAQPPTTTYTWNPTSVQAGQSTTATLTAVTAFPISVFAPDVRSGSASPNGVTDGLSGTLPFTLKLASLPAWFTPTGIQCDAVITNCSIANFPTGLTGTINGFVASTVTVTMTGTAAPPSNATAGSGKASGQGCNTWQVDADTTASACGDGQSVLGITGQTTPTAPPTTTLPPTTATTTGRSSGNDPSPSLLLGTLPALLAAAMVVTRREAHVRK
jgi:hypothetical protein